MKRQIRRLLAGLVASVALLTSAAVPASAADEVTPAAVASKQWNKVLNTSSPTIYQTNLWYTTAPMTPPASVTSTGTIIQTNHEWRVWDGPGTRGTLQVLACTIDLLRCTDITFTPQYTEYNGYEAYVSEGWTTAFAGLPANTQFVYRYRLSAPKTQTLLYPINSSMHGVWVNWDEVA